MLCLGNKPWSATVLTCSGDHQQHAAQYKLIQTTEQAAKTHFRDALITQADKYHADKYLS